MRNIIPLAHISLDGFMADPGGKIDFITFDPELADHIYPLMRTRRHSPSTDASRTR